MLHVAPVQVTSRHPPPLSQFRLQVEPALQTVPTQASVLSLLAQLRLQVAPEAQVMAEHCAVEFWYEQFIEQVLPCSHSLLAQPLPEQLPPDKQSVPGHFEHKLRFQTQVFVQPSDVVSPV